MDGSAGGTNTAQQAVKNPTTKLLLAQLCANIVALLHTAVSEYASLLYSKLPHRTSPAPVERPQRGTKRKPALDSDRPGNATSTTLIPSSSTSEKKQRTSVGGQVTLNRISDQFQAFNTMFAQTFGPSANSRVDHYQYSPPPPSPPPPPPCGPRPASPSKPHQSRGVCTLSAAESLAANERHLTPEQLVALYDLFRTSPDIASFYTILPTWEARKIWVNLRLSELGFPPVMASSE